MKVNSIGYFFPWDPKLGDQWSNPPIKSHPKIVWKRWIQLWISFSHPKVYIAFCKISFQKQNQIKILFLEVKTTSNLSNMRSERSTTWATPPVLENLDSINYKSYVIIGDTILKTRIGLQCVTGLRIKTGYIRAESKLIHTLKTKF